ncbi:MAG: hypothetical protein Q7T78_04970 [Rhodoferax sp.]|nr:hypothetical protein [Rhodoferax sp.]
MHINIGHQTRAALITVGCVGVLGMGGLAHAEPIFELTAAHPPLGSVHSAPWSAKVESPAMDSNDVEGRTNDATGAKSAQELLIRDRPGISSDTGRTDGGRRERAPLPADTQVMAPSVSFAAASSTSEDAEWRAELASTVLEAVRPAYEGLAGSGILEAVRSLESELGLDRGWSFNDSLSGNYSQNGGIGAHPESVSWAGPGNRSDTFNRPRSAAQIADDQRNAAALMEKFIEEVKPWVITLVAVYVLGYMVKFSLDYSQWKAARRRKHSALATGGTGRKRHRRHKRRPTV